MGARIPAKGIPGGLLSLKVATEDTLWPELSVGASDVETGIGLEYTLGYRNSRIGLYGTLITGEDDYCNEFKIFVL